MSLRTASCVLPLFALTACFGDPPPMAPQDADDLTRFIFREFDHEDPAVLEDAAVKLDAFLAAQIKFDGDLVQRSFELASILPSDIAGLDEYPSEQDPAKTIGMAVAYRSKWPVTDHARLQASDGLLEAEPSASAYERHFVEPTDPACFPTRECELMVTLNEITRSNFLMEVAIVLKKRFKWVALPDGRFAILSRSWNPRVFIGEDPDTAIKQSYTVDAWIGQADGSTWRYQGLFQESITGIDADKSTVIVTVTDGLDDLFEKTDEVIGERFHGK